jgi:hypothetical protein
MYMLRYDIAYKILAVIINCENECVLYILRLIYGSIEVSISLWELTRTFCSCHTVYFKALKRLRLGNTFCLLKKALPWLYTAIGRTKEGQIRKFRNLKSKSEDTAWNRKAYFQLYNRKPYATGFSLIFRVGGGNEIVGGTSGPKAWIEGRRPDGGWVREGGYPPPPSRS